MTRGLLAGLVATAAPDLRDGDVVVVTQKVVSKAEGRLGVVDSIRGRIADLGGTAELTTGTYGTEWELTVPRTSH